MTILARPLTELHNNIKNLPENTKTDIDVDNLNRSNNNYEDDPNNEDEETLENGESENCDMGEKKKKDARLQERPHSYKMMIMMALERSPEKRLTLKGIYDFITKNFPNYKSSEQGWKTSIRHNPSLNNCFIKVPRKYDEAGTVSYTHLTLPTNREV